MSQGPGAPVAAPSAEIPELIETLLRTERRLEELTAGEVDTIAGSDGRTFLLRRAQEELRATEAARQAAILDALPAHIALLDSQGVIVAVNRGWQRFAIDNRLGAAAGGVGRNYLEVCDRAAADGVTEAREAAAGLRRVLAGEKSADFSLQYTSHSPTEQRWFLLKVSALAGVGSTGAVVMHLNVSNEVWAQQELAAARNQLQHFVLESPAVIYSLRLAPAGPTLGWISGNVERLLGYSVADALAPDWWQERLHPGERERVVAELDTLFIAKRLVQEYRFRRKDGAYIWLRDEKRVLYGSAGQPAEVVGSWSDVGLRKDAERRLVESEEEYRLLFESNPHPMWVFDAATLRFLAVNAAAERMYGYSRDEFLAMTIEGIRPPEEVPGLLAYLAVIPPTPSLQAVHVKHRRKDGSVFEVEGFSNPIEFHGRRARLVLANDVSARTLLQEQFLQSQKLEAVGRLAGGVAHDFNNMLGVILGYTEMLLRQASDAQRGKLEQILRASKRAAGLTRQLLAFSRKQIVEPRILDLNVLLADLEEMLGRLIGEDIEMLVLPGAGLGPVKADPGQLEQVVMNLCVNARDAMPDGGTLRIETANVVLDAPRDGLPPGRYVRLTVGDSGCGIDKQTLLQIFEPFFTTKEEGKGTGLGLAMVYGVVKQAGGGVWAESEPGRGTTFSIHLPQLDAAIGGPEVLEAVGPSGSDTILLVEDEPSLREIAREILEERGYHVLEAAGAVEALELARGHPGSIQLLLTDVVMPGMNGAALAADLAAARPGMAVLYMSGYTDDVIAHRGVLEPGTLLIQKPFGAATLLGRVHDAIAARKGV